MNEMMKQLAMLFELEQMAQAVELDVLMFGSATFDDTILNYSEILNG